MTQPAKSFLRHYLRRSGLGQGRPVEIQKKFTQIAKERIEPKLSNQRVGGLNPPVGSIRKQRRELAQRGNSLFCIFKIPSLKVFNSL